MESLREATGFITEINEKCAYIEFTDEVGLEKKFIVHLSRIKFNEGEVPRSLIAKYMKLKCKFRGNTIESATIITKIELQIMYGKIEGFYMPSQHVIIKIPQMEIPDLLFQQLKYMNNQEVFISDIQKMQGKYVQVWFIGDSIIEAKVIPEGYEIALKVDTPRVKGDAYYSYFKDQRPVIHKIHSSLVFYQQTNQNVEHEIIQQFLGKEAKIVCHNGQLRVELNENPPLQAARENKTNYFRTDYAGENYESSSKTFSAPRINYGEDHISHKNKSLNIDEEERKNYELLMQRNQVIPSQLISSAQRIPSGLTPVHAKRTYFGQFGNAQLTWYIKEQDQNLFLNNPRATILAGLFDICYRFPEYSCRQKLKDQVFTAMINLNAPAYQPVVDQIFQICYNENSIESLEKLNSLIDTNSQFIEAIANRIFELPIDYSTQSNNFNVCFFLQSVTDGVLDESQFDPFVDYEQDIPVIPLYNDGNNIYLIYSESMMKYDGYDLVTGDLTSMHEVTYSWPITFRKIPSPIIDLAKSVEELVNMQNSFPQDGCNYAIKDLAIKLSKIRHQAPEMDIGDLNEIGMFAKIEIAYKTFKRI